MKVTDMTSEAIHEEMRQLEAYIDSIRNCYVTSMQAKVLSNAVRYHELKEELQRREDRLAKIMSNIHDTCLSTADEFGRPGDYVTGANVAGFKRVAAAMMAVGLV